MFPKKRNAIWLCPVFFLLAAAPGFWLPVLANILNAKGWGSYTTLVFMILPLSAIISPLFFSARADQLVAAEKLLAIIVGMGAILTAVAFFILEQGKNPIFFLGLFGLKSLINAPAWTLLTTITLSSSSHPETNFGKFRVWGTLGWMAAGLIVSSLSLDLSPSVGWMTVGASLLGSICCLFLPHTPPQGGPPKNVLDILGLRAFGLFRQRDIAVLFGTAFVFSIPLSAYFMHTPQQIRSLGCEQVAAVMTVGQVTEVFAMLLMGWLIRNWRIKSIFTLALGCGMLRYLLFALGAQYDSITSIFIGVALHGICWTYFFEAGRVFLSRRIDNKIRTQSQALLTLLTSGIGGLTGTAFVGWLHHTLVLQEEHENWSSYWWILTIMCGICSIGFIVGYKRKTEDSEF